MPKIDIAKIPVDTVCMYPEPFWRPIVGRGRKRLGNAVGLNQFGVLCRVDPAVTRQILFRFLQISENLVAVLFKSGDFARCFKL